MDFKHTNFDFETELPKLVRDNTPDIIRASGRTPKVRIADSEEEYLKFLVKKLREEGRELALAGNEENLQEELADVLEIIDAILVLKGWTLHVIQTIQKEKRNKNGGFTKRILLEKND